MTAHGVRIKKCCASCRNKDFDGTTGANRICKIGEGIVNKSDVCSYWDVNPILLDIELKANGMIKSKAYIQWLVKQVTEIREKELTEEQARNILTEDGVPTIPKTPKLLIESAKDHLIFHLPE